MHVRVTVVGEDVGRDGGFLRPAEVGRDGAVPLGLGGGDATSQAGFAEEAVARDEVARVTTTLVADLEEATGLAHGPDHRAGALDGVGHHLLAIHM